MKFSLKYRGLMIRRPRSNYERTRSETLLKVKSHKEREAKVMGYNPGSNFNLKIQFEAGKYAKLMGSLKCILPNGTKLDVGSGFSDSERKSPPAIGSIITLKYQELTDYGKRFF